MALPVMVGAVLNNVIKYYNDTRKRGGLSVRSVKDLNEFCTGTLKSRMEALKYNGEKGTIEYGQCEFMYMMIRNGWTIGDITFFNDFYEIVRTKLYGELKNECMEIIDHLLNTPITTVDERVSEIAKLGNYLGRITPQLEDGDTDFVMSYNDMSTVSLSYAEYLNDPEFIAQQKKDGIFDSDITVLPKKRLKNREGLIRNADYIANLPEDEKQKIRAKGDYVMSALTDEEIEAVNLNLGHKHNNIKKTNRMVMKEVFGEDVFDDIDEMRKGTDEERTISIHHATGNQKLRDGINVLEFDLAGSSFDIARKEYQGHHGKLNMNVDISKKELDRSIIRQYGPKDPYGKGKNIHVKSKDFKMENGQIVKKVRYSIAGPGLLNFGDYSIESTRGYVKDLAKMNLESLFHDFYCGIKTPTDIHINVTGHSRGAVSAGESVSKINQALKEIVKKNPKYKPFAKRVSIDLLERDPVPGFGSSVRFGKKDLRKYPNVNATVFCSIAQEHCDFAFPLQNVRGAKRIIISAKEHGMDLTSIDQSQLSVKDDSKAHQKGFYDAETGEYFRGSGIADMNDGVYMADDRNNLVRITSYSQLDKIMKSTYEGLEPQKRRAEAVHDMVRNWFVDNDLKISYGSDRERGKALEKTDSIIADIKKSKVSRLKDINRELRELDLIKADRHHLTSEKLIAQQKKVVAACKKYLEKTRLPAEGDSLRRVCLVGDLLSNLQRENNYLTRGLDKRPEVKHTGYKERQTAREQARLKSENDIKDMMLDTRNACESAVKILKDTGMGIYNTGLYDDFMGALKVGAKLSENSTVEEYMDILKDLKATSEEYKKWHEGSFTGPITDDGKLRLRYSEIFETYSEEYIKTLDNNSRYMADKTVPINKVIAERKEKYDALAGPGNNIVNKVDQPKKQKQQEPKNNGPKLI
ncbi:MAG: hypothetical protein IKQ71_00375 [Lachnospiraceae bacterium]|nr:hypothetical protein [Lachnospiraceae bacterium]